MKKDQSTKLNDGADALAKAIETVEPEKTALPVDEELRRAAAELDKDKIEKAEMLVSGKRVDKSPEGAKVDPPSDNADQRGGPEGNREDKGTGGDDPDKDKDPDTDEPSDEREKSEAEARDAFFKALADDPEVSPLLEASEALQGLAVQIGKAEGRRAGEVVDLKKSLAQVAARVEQIASVVGLIAKSQAILHKGMGELGRPVKLPMPGMVFDPRDKTGSNGDASGQALSKGAIVDALTKAMHDDKLDWQEGAGIMAKLDSNPQAAIAAIPDEVAKAYGIPKDKALQKAGS
jgi:hypothetical protein